MNVCTYGWIGVGFVDGKWGYGGAVSNMVGISPEWKNGGSRLIGIAGCLYAWVCKYIVE